MILPTAQDKMRAREWMLSGKLSATIDHGHIAATVSVADVAQLIANIRNETLAAAGHATSAPEGS